MKKITLKENTILIFANQRRLSKIIIVTEPDGNIKGWRTSYYLHLNLLGRKYQRNSQIHTFLNKLKNTK